MSEKGSERERGKEQARAAQATKKGRKKRVRHVHEMRVKGLVYTYNE